MLMQAEPVYLAYESVQKKLGYRPRVVYLTPQGEVFHQTMAKELGKGERSCFSLATMKELMSVFLMKLLPIMYLSEIMYLPEEELPGHGNDGFYFANGSRSFKK